MYCSIENLSEMVFTAKTTKVGEVQHTYKNLEKAMEIINEYPKEMRKVFIVESDTIEKNLSDIKLLSDTYKDIVFKTNNADAALELSKKAIPFFVNHNLFFADTMDKLSYFCRIGVTDVYITGELCFRLKDVKELTQEYGTKVRVIPNLVQHSGFLARDHMDSMCGFWIRPEDIDMYEEYVDVIEFYCEQDKQQTLYEIYFLDKEFKGSLGILIQGFDESIDNANLPPQFTEFRLNCGKICYSNKCHKCTKFKALAQLMSENDVELDIES